MDSIEALRIAALQFRTQAMGADTDTLIDLAKDVDRAREALRSARSQLMSTTYEMERLKSQLQMETECRGREKLRADKAECRNSEYRTAINDGERQLADARVLVRKLRKQLRAAKGGG